MASQIFARRIMDDHEGTHDALRQEAQDRYGTGEIFYILHETGEAVTTLPGCWPLGSSLGGGYEHPQGIVLDRTQVDGLGIEIEV